MHNPYAETYARFTPWQGLVPAGYIAKSTGSIARVDRLYPGAHIAALTEQAKAPRWVRTAHTHPGDPNYFELGAILMAIDTARAGFAMMELGAGTGPWTAQAACAVAARGIGPRHFLAVEAEPQRFAWLEDNLTANGIAPDERDLIRGVVFPSTRQDAQVMFPVGTPLFAGWGAKTQGAVGGAAPITYAGRTEEARLEPAPVVSLRSLFARCDRIYDIAHVDIQGAELDVLTDAADLLQTRLRAIAIGTHSPAIDAGLTALFTRLGWRCLVAFGFGAGYEVDGRKVATAGLDGFQHWINPAL
jgi:FkbM family methyltransferase